MENTLEKAEQIAKEAVENINKQQQEAAAKAETKGAAEKTEEKTEGEKQPADVEKQAQLDEKIMSAKEEELSEDDKKRKAQLIEEKEKSLSVDDKIKRVQEASQKRIDEIVSELKLERAQRNQDKEQIKKLENELNNLKKPAEKQDLDSKIESIEQQRINKYIEEDREKPIAKRREMSKEELETWFLEDPTEANAWITRREFRRYEEKKQIMQELTRDTSKEHADHFVVEQRKSMQKLLDKYPDVIPKYVKVDLLLGKSDEEVDKILAGESENARLAMKIVNSDHTKYLEQVNGPELVLQKLDELKGSSTTKKEAYSKEDVEKMIAEAIKNEEERKKKVSGGISSTNGKVGDVKPQVKSEFTQKQELLAKKAGMTTEQLEAMRKRRAAIPGAASFLEVDK